MNTSKKNQFLMPVLCSVLFSQATLADELSDKISLCAKQSNPLERVVCFDAIAEGLEPSAIDTEDSLLSEQANVSESQIQQANEQAAEQENTSLTTNLMPEKSKTEASKPNQSATQNATQNNLNELEHATSVANNVQRVDESQRKTAQPLEIKNAEDEAAKIASFGLPEKSEEKSFLEDGELYSVVASIKMSNKRRLRFTLENGQVWEKVDATRGRLPKVGDQVVLRGGALGAFYIRRAEQKRSFKVKRIDG